MRLSLFSDHTPRLDQLGSQLRVLHAGMWRALRQCACGARQVHNRKMEFTRERRDAHYFYKTYFTGISMSYSLALSLPSFNLIYPLLVAPPFPQL